MSNLLNLLSTAFKLTSTQGKPNAIYSKTSETGTGVYIDLVAPVDGWLLASIDSPAEDGLSRIRVYCKWSTMNRRDDLLASASFGKRPQGGVGTCYVPVLKGMSCGVWAQNGSSYQYQFVTDKSAG